MKNFFIPVILTCILPINGMEPIPDSEVAVIPCGTYASRPLAQYTIDDLHITLAYPFCVKLTSPGRVPENCFAYVEQGNSWATFPLNPCSGWSIKKKNIGKNFAPAEIFFAHLTFRTDPEKFVSCITTFLDTTDPKDVHVDVYSNITHPEEKDRTFNALFKEKSQKDRLTELVDFVIKRLAIPQKNVVVTLLDHNREETMKRFVAHRLRLQLADIYIRDGLPTTDVAVDPVAFKSAATRACNVARSSLTLAIDKQGNLLNPLPSSFVGKKQQSYIQDMQGKKAVLQTDVQESYISNSQLSKPISKKYTIPWIPETAPLYKISL